MDVDEPAASSQAIASPTKLFKYYAYHTIFLIEIGLIIHLLKYP